MTGISVTIIKEDDDDIFKLGRGSMISDPIVQACSQENPARFHGWVGNPIKTFWLIENYVCSPRIISTILDHFNVYR